MTSIVIADDQQLIRGAVASLLRDLEDIDVVGEATNGVEAVGMALRLNPDVVLMDIRMPVLDGIDATAQICADPRLADVKVLILTTFEEDDYLFAALRAGASGFIGKGSEPDEIIRAVRAVHAGEGLLSPSATRILITKLIRRVPAAPLPSATSLESLTSREREMLALVGGGLSNLEIADRLFISPHTVKTHVKRVMAKLHARDRVQLVIIAYETGVVVASS